MKNVLFVTISTLILIALFAYTMDGFYTNMLKMDEFDRALSDGSIIDVEVQFPFVRAIIFFLFGTFFVIFSRITKQKKGSSFLFKFWEFQDDDEREQSITNKATRASYVAVIISGCVGMGVMTLSTSVIYIFPALPIYLMASIIFIATLVYAITWSIEFSK